ncbi:MAG: GNAT family N-acetyltransferase [Ginsengibacter sp.]|jgi:predicted acetyltransferase
MEIKIRLAKKEDCHSMLQLIQELAVYEKSPDAVTVDFDHFVESGFGENPVWHAFVAEVNNNVVGFALYYIRYSTWKGQRMYLEDILVTDKWRGKGIGKLLFDQLIKKAQEKKFHGMVWQVLEWNKPAINFYKKYENVTFDNEWVNCSLEIKNEDKKV